MSNYTKTTNFGAKDTLPSGDSQKIIRGTEFDTEFNAISTAIATKLEVDGSNNLAISGTFSATKLIPTGGSATGNGMYLPAANAVAISTNGTERLRIDSSGVASFASNPILSGGTANGLVYLDGSKVATSGSAVTFDGTNFATTGTASATKLIPTGGSATGNGLYLPAANTVALSTNGTERLRVDSSGRLGLGVTPSAWSVSVTAFDISNGAVASSNNTTQIGHNAYYDGAFKYKANGFAAEYRLNNASGSHLWLVAPNNTSGAGAALSFTQAMTLDASGNLGLGVTPGAWGTTSLQIGVTGFNNYGSQSNLYNNTVTDASNNPTYISSLAASAYRQVSGAHSWLIAPSGTAGNAITFTHAMTLDAGGRLSVGRTPAATAVIDAQSDANGIVRVRGGSGSGEGSAFYGTSGSDTTRFAFGQVSRIFGGTPNDDATIYCAGYLSFASGAVERMRLDASGRLGLGTNSPSSSIEVATGSGLTAAISLRANAVTTTGEFFVGQDGGNAAYLYNRANSFIAFGTNNTERMRLDASGNLGVGVTPSAWSGGFKATQYPGGSVASYASGTNLQIEVGNAYYQSSLGTYTYYNTGTAPTLYRQISGEHRWLTAPSGTAGNAITFTTAMLLDSSGNLGIGTTSLAAKLHIHNSSADVRNAILANGVSDAAFSVATWQGVSGGADGVLIGSLGLSYSTTKNAHINFHRGSTTTGGFLTFSTNDNTERMRLKSTGQLRFVPLASDPAGAEAGDVYYNSTSNKLKVYNGTAWADLH